MFTWVQERVRTDHAAGNNPQPRPVIRRLRSIRSIADLRGAHTTVSAGLRVAGPEAGAHQPVDH